MVATPQSDFYGKESELLATRAGSYKATGDWGKEFPQGQTVDIYVCIFI